jgi:hypothetical protein
MITTPAIPILPGLGCDWRAFRHPLLSVIGRFFVSLCDVYPQDQASNPEQTNDELNSHPVE